MALKRIYLVPRSGLLWNLRLFQQKKNPTQVVYLKRVINGCAWQDSNLYALRHQILSLARLPISPQARRMRGRTLPCPVPAFKAKQAAFSLTLIGSFL